MNQEVELVETPYGKFHSIKGDFITKHLHEYGAHERNELAMLLSFVLEGDTVIEVGGHIGTYAIPMASRIGVKGCLFTFEASGRNYNLLLKNIEQNGMKNRVFAQNALITDKRGNYREVDWPSNTGGTKYFFSDEPVEEGQQVNCVVLDEWWQSVSADRGGCAPVALMKIDVEGMEYKVLRSCERLISENRPILFMEIDMAKFDEAGNTLGELEEFLLSNGYHFFRNTGKSTTHNDRFSVGKLENLSQGGVFYNLVALHPDNIRYPKSYHGAGYTQAILSLRKSLKILSKPFARFKRSVNKRIKRIQNRAGKTGNGYGQK